MGTDGQWQTEEELRSSPIDSDSDTAEVIELDLFRPVTSKRPGQGPPRCIQTHANQDEGQPSFFDEESWYALALETHNEEGTCTER